MRIGELARQSGTSIRSLRYYDAMGLLPARRQPNGYRQFDAAAVPQVRRIHTLLAHGFTVVEIRRLLPCMADEERGTPLCAVAAQTYQQQVAALDARIASLQAIRDSIATRLALDHALPLEEMAHDP